MSLEQIRSILQTLHQVEDWKLYAVSHRHTVRGGDSYGCRPVDFARREDLSAYVRDIQKEYLEKRLAKYDQVTPYDGSCVESHIYTLSTADTLLAAAYRGLMDALVHPDDQTSLDDFPATAYLLSASHRDGEGREVPLKLITVRRPLVTLRHKYIFIGERFTPPLNKVLSLSAYFDLLCLGETLYFFNLNPEPLFAMERAYKKLGTQRAQQVCDAKLVSDPELFCAAASAGHNPRRFVAFNADKTQFLSNTPQRRREVSDTFQIPLTAEGTFDTSDPANAEKLIKYLCDRAMLDPQDLSPREVSGAGPWR